MTIDKISLGQLDIFGLRDGFFFLDGGAMFGVVPKMLWEKKLPADEKNRIKLGLNSVLIKTEKDLILVETGIGGDLNPKFYDYYSVERKPGLVLSLEKLGYKAEDINFVINTHLHFDHCGGNTYKGEKGEDVPTFPKARYIIQKGEWEYALNPSERDKPSYLEQNFLPLERHGLLQLEDGDKEISEGVEVIVVPGHTSRHQCVKVSSGEKVLFFLGDLVPTSAHVGLSYIMSYDLSPQETLESKKRYFEQAIEEDWILAFNHDPDHFFGKVRKVNDKYTFEPLS
ncbi:MAG: MBL fold metallo-hydrolase [Candidatus Aminicenantes bacterium]|nr:MBL fold metallo-hydrolase [Candidatus Aminicenantes bacterium]